MRRTQCLVAVVSSFVCTVSIANTVKFNKIAVKGDSAPVPSGTGATTFVNFGQPVINDSNDVVFWGYTADLRSGIWKWNAAGSTLTLVAIAGQASGIGGTNFADFSRNPSINSSGHVAFMASLSSGGSAIVRWDAGSFVTIAQDSQNAPDYAGTSLGVTFGSFVSPNYTQPVFLSDTDDVLFDHVDSNGLYGWWIGNGTTLRGLAYGAGPGGAWAQYPSATGGGALWAIAGADINRSGTVGINITYEFIRGTLLRGTAGSLTLVKQAGDAAPAGSTTWDSIRTCSMNNSGQIASASKFYESGPPIDRFDSLSLLNSIVAFAGDPAPDTSADYYHGGNNLLLGSPSVNDSGSVIFSKPTDEAVTPPQSSPLYGLWYGVPGSLHLFAYDSYAIPCTRSGVVQSLGGDNSIHLFQQCLNNYGQFTAMGRYDTGGGSGPQIALFAAHPQYNRKYIVAMEGDALIDMSSTAYGNITALDIADLTQSETSGTWSLRTTPYNGYSTLSICGTIPIRASYDDGTTQGEGVFTWRIIPADVDGNGSYDVNDGIAFTNAYGAGNPCMDFDGDGTLNVNDYIAFQNAAAASGACP